VDHYAPSRHTYVATHDSVHPWRTRTLIATGIAVVELLALVAVGVIVLGKGWFAEARANAVRTASHHSTAATAASHASAKATGAASAKHTTAPPKAPWRPELSRAKTSVLVLNGNGQAGAAGAEARILRVLGYSIAAVGNATRTDYGRDIAMYLPGYEREARRLAADEKIPIVAPLDGLQSSQLHGAKVALIVGAS
jgi:LytR cell envelope-related transcriptional attenuator